jgi:hypothetical protein
MVKATVIGYPKGCGSQRLAVMRNFFATSLGDDLTVAVGFNPKVGRRLACPKRASSPCPVHGLAHAQTQASHESQAEKLRTWLLPCRNDAVLSVFPGIA